MKLEAWELFDLQMRRQGKPPTKQKEARYYGDPSKVVEFEAERKRQQEARHKKVINQKGE